MNTKLKDLLEEFDNTWKNTEGITVMDKPLRDFIKKAYLAGIIAAEDCLPDSKYFSRNYNGHLRDSAELSEIQGYNEALSFIRSNIQKLIEEELTI